MSIAHIAPRSRSVLRLHGWLLMAWAASVGFVTSALLLHAGAVHSLALRYTLGAGAVYFVGFVLGGWWYAKWWNARRGLVADMPEHASTAEVLEYQQAEEAARKKFEWFDGLGDFGSLGDDPLSALLAVFMLLGVVVVLALLMGYLPVLATDAFASFLAEVILEFVIGAVIARRVLKPRVLEDYWGITLRKTWLVGLLMMVVCGGVGYGIQRMNPEALTLFQLFR
ncbi:hypothetical protein [Rhodoferax sp. TS-BS-61-7]|uniref:hypothetical protein n=1 Tax=Rhodoferax sp. TS-BS-61-7 TaxID=2094194 RepID=UPI000CF694C4|nr:hypothetical protein [Rhodoferax sp. TS-BS-61-7]PQA76671.1 hypothetical protein C5F53_14345 [Rhodoferax sp. TS-BS-61-7]